jgi:hypothetical protein
MRWPDDGSVAALPMLQCFTLCFSASCFAPAAAGGDVLCAWLRRPADDSVAALLQPKRRRHALATSFTSLDARSYSEIANVQVCVSPWFCSGAHTLIRSAWCWC